MNEWSSLERERVTRFTPPDADACANGPTATFTELQRQRVLAERRPHSPSRPSAELSPTSHQTADPAGPDPPTRHRQNTDEPLPDE